jgi:sporulation protein YlmC with PRC-barrel domain
MASLKLDLARRLTELGGDRMTCFCPSHKTSMSELQFALPNRSLIYAAAVLLVSARGPAFAQAPAASAPSAIPAHTQPAKPAKPAPTPAAQQKGETPATVLDDKDVETILGREIYSGTGDDMGRIVDVVVDHHGNVRAAIIDFGGFLGVGSRKIAVDWHALQFNQDRAVSLLTRDQIRVAPEFKDGEPIVVVGPQSPAAPQQNKKPAATAPAK